MEENDPNRVELPPREVVRDDDLPPAAVLPKWVPILIGGILVMMAAAALWTGMKYRNEAFRRPLANQQKKVLPESGVGAPGEPQPGESRLAHRQSVPDPNPVVVGETSKYTITNAGGSISGVTRITVSRGMLLDISPPTALVYVNNSAIGEARQFSTPETLYEFADQGSYSIRISEEGHTDLEYVVTSAQDAGSEVAVLRGELMKK